MDHPIIEDVFLGHSSLIVPVITLEQVHEPMGEWAEQNGGRERAHEFQGFPQASLEASQFFIFIFLIQNSLSYNKNNQLAKFVKNLSAGSISVE